ncbi:MAG TPA: PPOX class F420-dependent oxidoreductase [Acidimicrobiales bacterium]|jgi:PPOX class probable F420-dependent enzyme|nr:PPOX class F420-dependent oxidoreductase [Acidimicrobiales bacterium]
MDIVTLSPEVRAVVESGRLAHFTTIAKDGRPHTTIVWVGLDGDDVVIGKLTRDQKLANIARDDRVSLSIEAEGNQWGMQHHLIIEGRARVEEGGAPALLQNLAQRYVGPGTVFPPMPNPPEGFVIHVSPTKVRGLGPWAPMPGA